MRKAFKPRRRVLLAEGETLLRDGLRKLLEDDFQVVGAVSDFESLRAGATRLRPDVVVAGLSLLLARGVEAARALRAAAPDARLIVLAREPQSAVPQTSVLGASGWVLRSSTEGELRAAVRAAATRRRLPSRLPTGLGAGEETGTTAVTPRAAEVVRLIARGKVMKEVAADLGISARTVAFHKYKTMRNLGLDSSAALVCYAVRNRML
jgi:DNA-binding NarL/FixJ family response regulator